MKNIHSHKTVMILVVMALTSAMVASLSLTAGAQDVNPPVVPVEEEESEEEETEETETEEEEEDLPPVEDDETEETETEEEEEDLPPVEDDGAEEEEEDLPPVEEHEDGTEEEQTITVTVVRGDSLWKLARIHLGSGWRWPEIFALNKGIVQADGRALTNPDLIIIGWVLEISLAPSSDTP